jgi:hypothetical protein
MEMAKQFAAGAMSGIETFVSLIHNVPFWAGWILMTVCFCYLLVAIPFVLYHFIKGVVQEALRRHRRSRAN